MDHLLNGFKNYLESAGVSKKTLTNYVSDLSNFLTWAASPNTTDLIARFDSELLEQYKKSLIENEIPLGTVNRRLSALRHFGKFLVWCKLTTENPAENLENLKKHSNRDSDSISEPDPIQEFLENERRSGATQAEINKKRAILEEFLMIAGPN